MHLDDDETTEPWQDFIQRATRIAEETISKLDIEEWTVKYWKRKWRWAQRISEQNQLQRGAALQAAAREQAADAAAVQKAAEDLAAEALAAEAAAKQAREVTRQEAERVIQHGMNEAIRAKC